jgi:hypothetical protein
LRIFACFTIIWRGEDRKMPMFSILSNGRSPAFPSHRCRVRGPDLHRISVGRGEIIDDFGDVGVVDRRAIGLDHLRHFGLPEFLLNFGPRGRVLM